MTGHEFYVFCVCLVVFVVFVALFAFLIGAIMALSLRLINSGVDDIKIEREFRRRDMAFFRFTAMIGKTVSALISLCLVVVFVCAALFALHTRDGRGRLGEIPMIKVVMTESMSEKYVTNKYLYENRLDDQFDAYDLVVIRELPRAEDLKLYDIVVYELEGDLIIHRIVDIMEPDETHSERRFVLQGDALPTHDTAPVQYKQMRGVYRGERVAHIGSFFLFMRSPGGYLCLFLVLICVIVTPILEKMLERARRRRVIGFYYYD